ncbi:MAG: YkgJ family cysteine cluster protein [Deltaproteobacteria bacterium]|nr:YkgJ family cysteine cluster protein [Deltaproteobacteria bacterium]
MFRSSFIEDLSMEILKIYDEIDRKVSEFKSYTKLACPKDCGECCSKGNAKMPPIEFIPLALELVKRGEFQKYAELLSREEKKLCVLYTPLSSDKKKGYCTFYGLRAATCRLYGYGFKKDKYGQWVPVMCEYLKKCFINLPKMKIEEISFPDYDSIMIRLVSLYPSLAKERYAPTEALLMALEKVSFLSFVPSTYNKYKYDPHNKKYTQSEKNMIE